tara:strand:- start:178 stop:393 length:216 start_codon:yes stop_codon:yes gene_type:complete
MSERTLQNYITDLLADTPDGEWRVVELTVKKKGDHWEVAEGATFGPFVILPKQIPTLAKAKEERDGNKNIT